MWEVMTKDEIQGGTGIKYPIITLDRAKFMILKKLSNKKENLIKIGIRWECKEVMAY